MPEEKIIELDAWKKAHQENIAQNVADATLEPALSSAVQSPKHDLNDPLPDQIVISPDDLKNADLKIPEVPDPYKTVRLMDNVPVLEKLERDWVSKIGFGKSGSALNEKIEAMNKKMKAQGIQGQVQVTSTKKAA
ncbi:MAG: hypothetical protein ACD_30C00110G0012 [uncultured bacterium]|uniref:Uncharacterized protein n=2 Tax=Candidatus Daviesiibacteriota TaxID=1752718 RepID=A0A1F5K5W7_9BACT|nr:MAG: hypothetical protein ACD_30C00110G0012 [uncultured bacterium]KKQ15689.1 MAG: hypothetical protein US28_C0012G0026 [Candidatus Daviesbacteria bacterium GW2011_GWA1_36_8]OGE33035.1 MAG: hypothetical protein A3C99_02060 [Candidatus Daviesbacteria bacterium RIFCSPHIGHO2_02_FULL_37_9]OGE36214.1 MAG: hypothetical protein A3E66_05420 [Candidatus Daviesbacteria bacterium RIFCSPHIGHO2_12_FULL_37_16]